MQCENAAASPCSDYLLPLSFFYTTLDTFPCLILNIYDCTHTKIFSSLLYLFPFKSVVIYLLIRQMCEMLKIYYVSIYLDLTDFQDLIIGFMMTF